MAKYEIHAELLLGRLVHDAAKNIIGRIEEIRVSERDGLLVVEEFHLGPHAVMERLHASFQAFPFLRLIGRPSRLIKLRWDELDFSDPNDLRVKIS
jgi:hypothetical protein